MKPTAEQMFDLARYAFTRLDGAWFLAVINRVGKDAAWEADVAAWEHLAYVLGKRIRQEFIPDPVWPDSFVTTVELFWQLMMISGREIIPNGRAITFKTTDCEMQRMIAKAGVADCGIATRASYIGLAKGLFGKEFRVEVDHPSNLNSGDPVCEVIVRKAD